MSKEKNYAFGQWKKTFNIDAKSSWGVLKTFSANPVLDLTQNTFKPNSFRAVLFDKNGEDVQLDFSKFNLQNATEYTIRDVENYNVIYSSGTLDDSKSIKIAMKSTVNKPFRTPDNFGVFIVEFSEVKETVAEKENLIKRFFNWLF